MSSWSPQQDGALKAVEKWLRNDADSQQVFRLFGYAGTGKTTLAIEIANMASSVLFAAFTGKASMVLQSKGCYPASTIHSLIYKPKENPRTGKVEFVKNYDSDLRRADLLIVDEVSMVDEKLGIDLLSYKVPILVLGDPAQLPPVSGTGYFTERKPDIMLTEIHRQAAESPIIHVATKARNGERIEIGRYGEDVNVIERPDLTQSTVMKADQLLVGMNRTRQSMNEKMRALKGYTGEVPNKGEKLVCLKNWRDPYLLNGSLWTVDRAKKNKMGLVLAEVLSEDGLPDAEVEVPVQFFTGREAEIDKHLRKFVQEFTYGYALTCHKSQGSQWDNVVIFDEAHVFREDADRWRYTALTRAAQKLTLVVG